MGKISNLYTVRANIHTFEIETFEKINVTKMLEQYARDELETAKRINACIKATNNRFGRGAKTGKRFILNLNKWFGTDIFYFSEFTEILKTITDVLGIGGNYKIIRCDMKLDSTDDEFYERNKKLVRLMLTAVANGYSLKNIYRAEDGATLEQRSFRVVASNWDIEYYNKNIESEGKDPSKARLELRLMNNKNGITDLQNAFGSRLTDIFLHMGDGETADLLPVLEQSNEVLFDKWVEGGYKNLHIFLEQRNLQEIMFTRSQLVMLIERISASGLLDKKITNIQKYIDNHFNRYSRITFVNESQMTEFWQGLIDAKDNYLAN